MMPCSRQLRCIHILMRLLVLCRQHEFRTITLKRNDKTRQTAYDIVAMSRQSGLADQTTASFAALQIGMNRSQLSTNQKE